MASVFTVSAGAFGFLSALFSMALGSGFLTALAVWSLLGMTIVTLGFARFVHVNRGQASA